MIGNTDPGILCNDMELSWNGFWKPLALLSSDVCTQSYNKAIGNKERCLSNTQPGKTRVLCSGKIEIQQPDQTNGRAKEDVKKPQGNSYPSLLPFQ